MPLPTEYLLKLTICSGILTAYYWLVLRNSIFHRWNRFYLLGTVMVSLILPLLRFQFRNEQTLQNTTTYQILKTITTNDTWFETSFQPASNTAMDFSAENIITAIYWLVSLFILLGFLKALLQIQALYKQNRAWKTENLIFVDTDAKGTPFSFFHIVFWNRNISVASKEGQQILAHELVHIREWHSIDKLLLNVLLVIFWINPFFWLIRKEVSIIHEFIADKKSITDGDGSALALMILTTAFPNQKKAFINPFFYSPIKRRILMLSKKTNPKASYFSRILILPMLFALFTAFSVKMNPDESNDFSDAIRKGKDLTGSVEIKLMNSNEHQHSAVTSSNNKSETNAIVERINITATNRQSATKETSKRKIVLDTIIIPKGTEIYSTAESLPQFPGGDAAWDRHLQKVLKENIEELINAGIKGTCEVEFIVTPTGQVTNLRPTYKENSKLAQVLMSAIINGPRWIPGINNGKKVYFQTKKSLTLHY